MLNRAKFPISAVKCILKPLEILRIFVFNFKSRNKKITMIGKILITESVPSFFIDEMQKQGYIIGYEPGIDKASLLLIISNYTHILVRSTLIIDREIIDKAISLEYILRPGSGLDNIDITYANSKAIQVLNSPDGNMDAVGEHAVGMLLAMTKRIYKSFDELKKMNWNREENRGDELYGLTVGIIGYGHTGSAFAKKLSGFNVEILAYDKYKSGYANEFVKESSLEELYKCTDVLSLHLPLTEETSYYLNTEFLNRFQKPLYFINTSRGKIVELESILKALQTKKIRAAALDVLENEKLETYTESEVRLFNALIDTGKVILTPHIAGWTHASKSKIYKSLLRQMNFLLI
jgi:D-3-phosphoglycerate dehydrogenase / 2-oxoglutarate reductase